VDLVRKNMDAIKAAAQFAIEQGWVQTLPKEVVSNV